MIPKYEYRKHLMAKLSSISTKQKRIATLRKKSFDAIVKDDLRNREKTKFRICDHDIF